ncbi:hypothetical protein EGI22_20500 [Lacihabitans sp. LS3-19]|uniref:SprB repeat-containing protein n=1 Tax=Lacihabitans sp. LS3-19 TaxID=2487335 RepID=UPI0020CD1F3A|nr:SprB repeat-containing protein [Lacihabitans sp. LS3-19]MCP9770293.1 hypothetical protein [Lacihabitans sp. LS3-19]
MMIKLILVLLLPVFGFGQKDSSTFQVTSLTLGFGSQTNISCFGGKDGAASVLPASGGVAPYTYNWTPGTPIGDGTVSVTGLTSGTWTCTAKDFLGNTVQRFFQITQPTSLLGSVISITNASNPSATDGAATIEGVGGTPPYIYNWSPGNPTGDGTATITDLSPGIYTCTIKDAKSCTSTLAVTVGSQLSVTALSQTNVTCFGGSNGAAAVNEPTGGTPPYTYNWTPGNPVGDGTKSVTNLTAGTWTCNVSDALGALTSLNFIITKPPSIVMTANQQTNVSFSGASDGAAIANPASGGTPPYSYNWTPGNPIGDGTLSVTGLTAGTWTCNAFDSNGCTSSVAFQIVVKLKIAPSPKTDVSCFGGSDGTATVALEGGKAPFSFNWTPGNPTGDGTSSISGLNANTYTCTVTDAQGTVVSTDFVIQQPNELTINDAEFSNVSCPNGQTGIASILSLGGGTPIYIYNWTPGNPIGDGTPFVTDLTSGTWSCTVTDSKGCVVQKSFVIGTDFQNVDIILKSPIDDLNANTLTKKTMGEIYANIQASNMSVLNLTSDKSILLDAKKGVFEIENGSIFEAKIEGCKN